MERNQLEVIVELAMKYLPIIAEAVGDGRRGGYLCVGKDFCYPDVHIRLGEPDSDKIEKYFQISLEKGRRLERHPEHLLSRQSRNPDELKYAGGVRAPGGIFISFSGLTEDGDEAFVIALAIKAGLIREKTARQVLGMHGGNTAMLDRVLAIMS